MPPRARTSDSPAGETTPETAPEQSQAEAEKQVSKAFDGSQVLKVEPEDGVVIYSGPASTRRVSANDWSRAGVPNANETVWNLANDFRVKKSDLTEEQLKILAKDPSFTIG